MNILSVIHLIISWLLIIAVLLPFVRNDYWVFRIFEYPRYQKFILCCLVLAGFILTGDFTIVPLVTCIILGLCVMYLTYKISPYTPLYRK